MSIDTVNEFWGRIDSDKDFQTKFVSHREMTLAQIVEFAGEHGFKFTEDDLKTVANTAPAADHLRELSDNEIAGVVGGAGFRLSINNIQSNIRSVALLGRGIGPITV